MRVKLAGHARERASQRGATEEEIVNVIEEGIEIQAKKARRAREKIFDHGKEWLGRVYPHKKVVVVYAEENEDIVVITVKVYYGKWR